MRPEVERRVLADGWRLEPVRGTEHRAGEPTDGVERLSCTAKSITPEAACTSVQLHLQVTPGRFADVWNAAQAVAAVQVAVGANSPFLFGRELWRESRPPLFLQSTDTRPPEDGSNRPMNVNARCTEPPTQSNARGAQNAPQRAPASYAEAAQSPVVGAYDPETGKLTWGDPTADGTGALSSAGSVAPPSLGEESWKWLFLQPLMTAQE